MAKPDGGSAFPRAGATLKRWDGSDESETTYLPVDGMSLRDYFAAQALGYILRPSVLTPSDIYWDEVARLAYVAADAMLKAREA